jgi:cyanate lyase
MTISTTPGTRLWAGQQVMAAKQKKGVSWEHLADVVGHSLVWSTSALLGQQPLTAEQAKAVGAELDLGDDVVEALQLPPDRGAGALDRSDPVVYRLEEAVQVYGSSIAALIAEEFGDGIMSAIDFHLEFARAIDSAGDRVQLTFSGKFLPYRVW